MHNLRKFAYASFLKDAIFLFFSVNLRKPGTFSTRQIIWTVGYKFLLGPKTQNLGLRIIGTRFGCEKLVYSGSKERLSRVVYCEQRLFKWMSIFSLLLLA
jgi:hypothetical protein